MFIVIDFIFMRDLFQVREGLLCLYRVEASYRPITAATEVLYKFW